MQARKDRGGQLVLKAVIPWGLCRVVGPKPKVAASALVVEERRTAPSSVQIVTDLDSVWPLFTDYCAYAKAFPLSTEPLPNRADVAVAESHGDELPGEGQTETYHQRTA